MAIHRFSRFASPVIAAALTLYASAASGQEVHVLSSGGVAAPYVDLVSAMERTTGQKLVTVVTSTGVGQQSIPNRLRRGDRADVVLLPDAALRELIKEGLIAADSRVPIGSSGIGMAVRFGLPKPDITTTEGLRRALLQAKSIAYSAQVSGLYLANELFPRLGIADQLRPKSIRVERERVGAVVARGEADIGFQQISELLPIKGIDYVGPLPADVQRMTLFSGGVAASSKNPEGARAVIAFFKSAEGVKALRKYQLQVAKNDQ
jgi:molybdate transport system substrate-binding protein